MRRKSIGIFMCLLMLMSCIVPTIFTEDEPTVKATSTTGENVGLDYTYIFEKLNNLSSIVLTRNGIDNGIYKGRDFGTDGERYAAREIRKWMENISTNLTGSEVVKEPIGYNNGGWDKWNPRKSDITGFNLQLKNGTHDAFTISTNESMPVVSFIPLQFGVPINYSSPGFCTVEKYPSTSNETYDYYKMFNITYTRIT